eukprot:scaffold293490_cov33-Tisochrysis_lutea.AAC.1
MAGPFQAHAAPRSTQRCLRSASLDGQQRGQTGNSLTSRSLDGSQPPQPDDANGVQVAAAGSQDCPRAHARIALQCTDNPDRGEGVKAEASSIAVVSNSNAAVAVSMARRDANDDGSMPCRSAETTCTPRSASASFAAGSALSGESVAKYKIVGLLR